MVKFSVASVTVFLYISGKDTSFLAELAHLGYYVLAPFVLVAFVGIFKVLLTSSHWQHPTTSGRGTALYIWAKRRNTAPT